MPGDSLICVAFGRKGQPDVAYETAILYAPAMRTTIDIPEELLEKARRGAGLRTKQETVTRALHELIQRNAFEGLRRLAGKVDLDIDIAASRERNKRPGR